MTEVIGGCPGSTYGHGVEDVMTVGKRAVWLTAAVWLVASACGPRGPEPAAASSAPAPAPAIPAEARSQAREIFATRCAACHGPDGRGDGPGAAAMVPKPRNYHDAAWQAQVKDDEIEKAIVYGGASVGRSPAMVGNPDLGSKPDVVAALRDIVREFGRQQ
jgi:mono/diheme cytochrome c family protein